MSTISGSVRSAMGGFSVLRAKLTVRSTSVRKRLAARGSRKRLVLAKKLRKTLSEPLLDCLRSLTRILLEAPGSEEAGLRSSRSFRRLSKILVKPHWPL